jgi:Virulence factor
MENNAAPGDLFHTDTLHFCHVKSCALRHKADPTLTLAVFALFAAFNPRHRDSMANLIITYWRDIPSSLSVKLGRKEEKRMLDNRFMEAIDMAAMRDGATNTDDYLADWRRADALPVSDDLAAEADKAKAELEATYSQDRIKQLIGNGGRNAS